MLNACNVHYNQVIEMQYLNNLLDDGYLCKSNDNINIGTMFTEIFALNISAAQFCKFLIMRSHNHFKRCIICAKYTGTNYITICNYCVRKCVGYNVKFKLDMLCYHTTNVNLSYNAKELFNSIFPGELKHVLNYFKQSLNYVGKKL